MTGNRQRMQRLPARDFAITSLKSKDCRPALFWRLKRSRESRLNRPRNQTLARLAGMHVAEELVLRRCIQQSRLAGIAARERVRGSDFKGAEHVGHDRPKRCCRRRYSLN